MQSFVCQSCSAPIQVENQFIRSVTCEFCGNSYVVSGSSGLESAGKGNNLADYPSRLKVGMSGTLQGHPFHILGRVRYRYDEGFWDEWQIQWEDGSPPDWLEEDEGFWILYKRERVKAAVPPYEKVSVGSTIKVNRHQVFITEKRRARVLGSEGQFSSVMPLQGEFGYYQGAADDKSISITLWEDEIELSVGQDVEFHEVTFEN